jgi:hypothetical protein
MKNIENYLFIFCIISICIILFYTFINFRIIEGATGDSGSTADSGPTDANGQTPQQIASTAALSLAQAQAAANSSIQVLQKSQQTATTASQNRETAVQQARTSQKAATIADKQAISDAANANRLTQLSINAQIEQQSAQQAVNVAAQNLTTAQQANAQAIAVVQSTTVTPSTPN